AEEQAEADDAGREGRDAEAPGRQHVEQEVELDQERRAANELDEEPHRRGDEADLRDADEGPHQTEDEGERRAGRGRDHGHDDALGELGHNRPGEGPVPIEAAHPPPPNAQGGTGDCWAVVSSAPCGAATPVTCRPARRATARSSSRTTPPRNSARTK